MGDGRYGLSDGKGSPIISRDGKPLPVPDQHFTATVRGPLLAWTQKQFHEEAILGDFDHGDGVRFNLMQQPTCYRRGPWKLLVEVADGPGHIKWGCFDDQDQPIRYYHSESIARQEAEAIAQVLQVDRWKKE